MAERKSTERTRRQRAARALGDAALIAAMREGAGDGVAWAEFERRFRPVLEVFAARVNVAYWERDECITEVLDDAAMKLIEDDARVPDYVSAYLVGWMRHHLWKRARAAARRDRSHRSAATVAGGEYVVRTVCSEQAVRESSGMWAEGDSRENVAEGANTGAGERLANALMAQLSTDEQRIIAWVSESVPYRQIAEWTGGSYAATSKRIWRLLRRLRGAALSRASTWSDEDRSALARYFSRRTS